MAKLNGSEPSNQGVPSVDRISALPESLICHILSLLPTHYAVRTCILSKTWKHMWTNVRCVNFDDDMYNGFNFEEESKKFEQFVYRVLLLLKTPCLHTFHLNCGALIDPSHVSTWIFAALSHDVRELILDVCQPKSFKIPINLFTCKTLSCLRLDTTPKTILDVPNSVYLPNLKVMHLCGLTLANDETFPKLLSGCPVLEHLCFVTYGLDNILHFSISSHTLKSLHLDFVSCTKHDCPRHTLQIDAPLLKYLYLNDNVSYEFATQNLSSLIQADISLNINRRNNDEIGYGNEVLKLINGLSNVKFLKLSVATMKALSYARENVTPVLRNLTRLNGCFTMHKALRIQPDDVPKYLLSHLTTVEFTYFDGSTDELKMVKFLLKEAKSLKRLTIKNIHPETKLDLLQKITMFRRDSKLCELVVL